MCVFLEMGDTMQWPLIERNQRKTDEKSIEFMGFGGIFRETHSVNKGPLDLS